MSRFVALLTRWGLGRLAKKRNRQPAMVIHSNDFIGADIMAFGGYEQASLDCLVQAMDFDPKQVTALDIGANIGTHSRAFSAHFKEVHAFEPHPRNFELLQLNTRAYRNIVVHPFGLSDRDREATLYVSSANMGGASLVPSNRAEETVEISLRTLDSMAEGSVGLIKIDVEGHEPEALKGLIKVIDQHKPLLAVECNFRNGVQQSLLQQLEALGYSRKFIPHLKNWTGAVEPSFLNQLLSSLFFSNKASMKEVETLQQHNYPMVLFVHSDSRYGIKISGSSG